MFGHHQERSIPDLKQRCCMGFSFRPSSEALIHVDDPMNETPRVVIEIIGGRYINNKIYSDTPTTKRHTELSQPVFGVKRIENKFFVVFAQ